MAYVSKEGYERKAAYAARRMAENAEVETLTAEQHEALAELCEIRHWIHSTDRMRMFNSEASESDGLSDRLARLFDSNILADADLPELRTIDIYMLPSSSDWELLITEEDRQAWKERSETEGFANGYDCWLNLGDEFHEFCQMIGQLNADIERYLADIDKAHGTSYCPTGKSRA